MVGGVRDDELLLHRLRIGELLDGLRELDLVGYRDEILSSLSPENRADPKTQVFERSMNALIACQQAHAAMSLEAEVLRSSPWPEPPPTSSSPS